MDPLGSWGKNPRSNPREHPPGPLLMCSYSRENSLSKGKNSLPVGLCQKASEIPETEPFIQTKFFSSKRALPISLLALFPPPAAPVCPLSPCHIEAGVFQPSTHPGFLCCHSSEKQSCCHVSSTMGPRVGLWSPALITSLQKEGKGGRCRPREDKAGADVTQLGRCDIQSEWVV